MEPERERTYRTICSCRMVYKTENEKPVYDSCSVPTSGPDQPFCEGCEKNHVAQSICDPIIKPMREVRRV